MRAAVVILVLLVLLFLPGMSCIGPKPPSISSSASEAPPRVTLTPLPAAATPIYAGPAVPPPVPATTPTPEWVTQPATAIYLNPKSQHASPGSEVTVNVEIMPANWGVSAGEMKLSFDPGAMETVRIRPGDFLGPNPLVGSEKVDNQGGTVTYALARVGKTTVPATKGTFATISFKIAPSAKGTLKLEITRLDLANEKFENIKGLQVQGATIVVD